MLNVLDRAGGVNEATLSVLNRRELREAQTDRSSRRCLRGIPRRRMEPNRHGQGARHRDPSAPRRSFPPEPVCALGAVSARVAQHLFMERFHELAHASWSSMSPSRTPCCGRAASQPATPSCVIDLRVFLSHNLDSHNVYYGNKCNDLQGRTRNTKRPDDQPRTPGRAIRSCLVPGAALPCSLLDASEPLTPDDPAAALAFALRYQGRKRVHNADEIMAEIVAARLVDHLERAGFVVIKRASERRRSDAASKDDESRLLRPPSGFDLRSNTTRYDFFAQIAVVAGRFGERVLSRSFLPFRLAPVRQEGARSGYRLPGRPVARRAGRAVAVNDFSGIRSQTHRQCIAGEVDRVLRRACGWAQGCFGAREQRLVSLSTRLRFSPAGLALVFQKIA